MTKIALVLSGSAAAGAYTAGATVELLRALEADRSGSTEVGVLAGSGAGAFVAALAARSLVVNPNLVPWIERSWAEALDVDVLLNPRRRGRRGWLDREPVEELLGHMVAGEPARDDSPSGALGDPLQLGFALTDLHGRLRTRPVADPGSPEESFGRVDHRSSVEFELTAARRAGDPVWREVAAAAAAGFARAGVFPPRRLLLGREGGDGEEGVPRWHGEAAGGLDRPIRLARRLQRRARSSPGEAWRYVVVDPRLTVDPAEDEPLRAGEEPDSAAAAAGLWRRALEAHGLPEEWETAQDTGARLRMLRDLVERLPEIHGSLGDPDAVGLGRRIGELAERVAERQVSLRAGELEQLPGDPVLHHMDRHLQRIQQDPAYAPVFEETDSRAGRTRLAKLVYVLESLGDLQGKEPLQAHLVAPDPETRLMTAEMAGLAGFLSPDRRRHDIAAGRRDARRLLTGPLSDLVAYEPDEEEAYRPPGSVAGSAGLSDPERRRLLPRLEAEADRILEDLRPGGLGGLFFGLVRPGLRRAAGRRMLAALENL